MKICIIGTAIPPVTGGLETYTHELARHLILSGHEVCLIGYQTFPNTPLYEKKDDIHIYRVPNVFLLKNKAYFIFAYNLIKKLHKKFNFDIIHAQTAAPAGFTGALLKCKYKLPLVITSHGFELIVRGEQWWVQPFIKFAFKHADKIIGVSEEMSELSIQNGADKLKTVTMANAVDTALFTPNPLNPSLQKGEIGGFNIRQKLGIPSDKIVILALRRLVPKTGVQYLIKIAPDIIKMYPDVYFLIVGTGQLENELTETVNKLGMEKNIIFTGTVPNHDVPDYIRAADFSVFPSFAEATSIACLEVMSCEKPVVVSNVGGLPEIVKHEKTGLIVDFKKTNSTYNDYGLPDEVIDSLKCSIIRLIKDENLRKKLGENARNFVINNYSWDIYLRKILKIYTEIGNRHACSLQ